jgi:hypothetical protein
MPFTQEIILLTFVTPLRDTQILSTIVKINSLFFFQFNFLMKHNMYNKHMCSKYISADYTTY